MDHIKWVLTTNNDVADMFSNRRDLYEVRRADSNDAAKFEIKRMAIIEYPENYFYNASNEEYDDLTAEFFIQKVSMG
uniref:Uncharacterized protein n=1 Tax=Romanomermis culicivorax TaxID=13658 RepID=A0A915K3D1_ROMCU